MEGQQYSIHCRRLVRDGEVTPPMPEDGKPLDGEEVLLDGNQLAEGKAFFSLGALSVSPDGKLLAYSADFAGDERYTLRIKDLVSGEILADEVPDTSHGTAWSLDGSALFYVTVDEAWRPFRVWRHVVGTPTADDVVVFEENDEKFWLGVGTSRDEKWLVIRTSSKLTSEVHLLDAATPDRRVLRRRAAPPGRRVRRGGRRGPAAHPAQRRRGELRARLGAAAGPRRHLRLDAGHRAPGRHPAAWVDAFESYLVLYYRRDGLTGLSVLPPSGIGEERPITFPEPIYTVGPGANPEYAQTASGSATSPWSRHPRCTTTRWRPGR